MRVLQIMGSLHRGGAETIVMNYYRAFDKNMCQFDFVVHGRFENDYVDEAKKLGASVFLVSRPGVVGPFKYIKELTKTIKRNGPYDAIHIHTNSQAFMCVIAAKLASVKRIIVHSHSTRFTKLTLPVNRAVFAMAGVIRVACGEAAGRSMFGSKEYIVLNNAINASNFYIEDESDREKNETKTIIGHLGRLCEVKNQIFLIDVIREVSKRVKIELQIYGEGPYEDLLREHITNAGLQDVVKLMGVTQKPFDIYHDFDLFVLPSLYEGFPVTLVETQMSGIPTIASNTISKECDFSAGLLSFIPLDENEWINAIEHFISNPSVAIDKTQLIEKSKEYDTAFQWKRLYEIYEGRRKE